MPIKKQLKQPQAQVSETPEVVGASEVEQVQTETVITPTIKKQLKKVTKPLKPFTGEPTRHIVKRGESLYRISVKYNVKMSKLIEWNQIDDPTDIEVGTALIVSEPLKEE